MSEHLNYRLYPIFGKPDGFTSGVPTTVYAYGYNDVNESIICKPLNAIVNDNGDYRICVPIRQLDTEGHTCGRHTFAYISKNKINKFENLEFTYGAHRYKYYTKDGHFKSLHGKYVSIYTTDNKHDTFFNNYVSEKRR